MPVPLLLPLHPLLFLLPCWSLPPVLHPPAPVYPPQTLSSRKPALYIHIKILPLQKKKITAFLLALAMVSAMALPVFAQEPNPQAETAASIAVVETATPETAATEEPKVDAEPAEDNVKEDAATYDASPENGWYQEYPGGPWYWYENGVRQGTTGRGKEIYDPKSDAWYWLDAVQGGAMTTNKDVYQDSNGGKWVRYDANGHMVKGWNTNEKGTYYFDLVTGAMVKGMCTIDGIPCAFDTTTGIGLDKQWVNINGDKFWYEGGKRQVRRLFYGLVN